jgi:hypothetical protein
MSEATNVPVTEASSRRVELYSLLGLLPDRDRDVRARLITTRSCEDYDLEVLLLDLNGIEPVPAYFTKPHNGNGPMPVILYNHASGGDMVLGKDELLFGRPSLRKPPYAEELARAGYGALCLDMWGFGERRGRTLDAIFKDMIWHGQVLWGMMVYDSLKALDYLSSRAEVDPARIGTLGLSSGSTMAWWISALSVDVGVCIDICCLTEYEALIRSGGLDRHGVYYYVPNLLNHFTTSQINALIAPRPHLGLAGIYDPLTPVDGLDIIDLELQAVYSSMKAADAWRLSRYPCGHLETDGMRAEIVEFLAKWL